MYIDIHNHSLYGVDDGADTMETSIAMLEEAARQQARAIILTPHYRRGMFRYPKERIEEHYELLKGEAHELGIDLFLGCEYHVDGDMLDNLQDMRCHTLADGEYVLTEYSYDTPAAFIASNTRQLLSNGYLPVIAHVERYGCVMQKPELCRELANMGAMIQINADSVLGYENRHLQKLCKKLLKNSMADIVASDTHDMKQRANHMQECQEYVRKKYGEAYERQLFYENPGKIVNP